MTRGVGGHSPANIARYLSGIDFPCEKSDLIHHAEENGAEDDVLEVFHNLPEGEYGTMADVMKGYGEARDGEHEADDDEENQQSHRSRAQRSRQNRDAEAAQGDGNGGGQRSRHSAEAQGRRSGRQGAQHAKGGKLDLNTASHDDLMQVEGLGAHTADQIIRYREENGPFQNTEELCQVPGIGEATFNRLKDMVSVSAGERSRESEEDEAS
jgi:competence ComEA-like helix-hairpin-helix protein